MLEYEGKRGSVVRNATSNILSTSSHYNSDSGYVQSVTTISMYIVDQRLSRLYYDHLKMSQS